MPKTAIIIGAGPAGLTAAYELLIKTDIKPIILEKTADIGGISKTVVYKGNRLDIGGHRFFSKSDVVMNWWKQILPLQGYPSKETVLLEKQLAHHLSSTDFSPNGPDPEKTDKLMLIRKRVSRIFFSRHFFDYPISLNSTTIANLGFVNLFKIGLSYCWVKLFPLKKIKTLEEFFISRFGKELYNIFFKDYTEKVWGVPCSKIEAGWGAQRVKELSVTKALIHALKSCFKKTTDLEQKSTETSLIEKFMYPKFGPGQLWETVAQLIEEKGGKLIKNAEAVELKTAKNSVSEITYIANQTGKKIRLKADYFFSTMPVKELIACMGNEVSAEVKAVSEGLQYRDFITVGLLLNSLKIKNKTKIATLNQLVPDNWIYIQEREVKVGRLQVFNNWSPYMVADIDKVWIGLEYFCNEGDELWRMNDDDFVQFAINELHSIDIIDKKEVIDSTIIRVPKTYPAYFGTYAQFDTIRNFTDTIENLFLIGRNGMHKYNNQDHSMLTAIAAVNNIISGEKSKDTIWNINVEEKYHESK
ncbi:MAG: NAD(P)/FAD-dependent oxidoreductase [Paludibacteraceae bacterium]|nr:NAD(P)/FAD-dependent oxidoreductase [Paludibacteraceae bacterium]